MNPIPAVLDAWTGGPWGIVLIILLNVAGLLVLTVELVLVNSGILTLVAIGCAIGGLFIAFAAGQAVGWTVVIIEPIAYILVTRWSIGRLRRSRVTLHDVVSAQAGYEGLATDLGISIGDIGDMVTEGTPGGRARFPGGEVDVIVRGDPVGPHAAVRIIGIDGSSITVTAVGGPPAVLPPAPAAPPAPPTPPSGAAGTQGQPPADPILVSVHDRVRTSSR